MHANTDSDQTARETALRIEELVRTRKQLKAAGADFSSVDAQIKPFKAIYIRAGTSYGGNYAGMVKWFHERASV